MTVQREWVSIQGCLCPTGVSVQGWCLCQGDTPVRWKSGRYASYCWNVFLSLVEHTFISQFFKVEKQLIIFHCDRSVKCYTLSVLYFISDLLRNIRTQVLIKLIKPYTRIHIPFISKVSQPSHMQEFTHRSYLGKSLLQTMLKCRHYEEGTSWHQPYEEILAKNKLAHNCITILFYL